MLALHALVPSGIIKIKINRKKSEKGHSLGVLDHCQNLSIARTTATATRDSSLVTNFSAFRMLIPHGGGGEAQTDLIFFEPRAHISLGASCTKD